MTTHGFRLMCAFSLVSLFANTQAEERFSIDNYLALKSVAEIAVSPDGQFAAYTVTSNDLEKDRTRDRIWMQPLDGGTPIPMTSDASGASSPKFSPDGRYLAILSDRKDETSQVWLLDRRGGDAQQLTEFKQGVDSFSWSPDGRQMLLIVEDPTPADLDEEERPNPRPYVVDRLQFKQDYVGYLDRHRTHIHVIDVSSRKTRQITSGDFDDSEAEWAPDNRNIVFVSNRTDNPDGNRNTDLWLVDSQSDDYELTQLTTSETADGSPSFSPDGSKVVFTSTVAGILPIYALPELAVLDLESGTITKPESLREIQVFDPRFARDGDAVLAIAEQRGEMALVKVDIESGATQSLIDHRDSVSEYSELANGNILAAVSRPQLPEELFVLDNMELRQLSSLNKSVNAKASYLDASKHSFKHPDGTEIETFVMLPEGHRKPGPGILFIHGGPQAQWDWSFNSEAQLLAAQGYAVVMPNPRGSTGYGQAFTKAIYRDWGGIDYEDVMASMDFAVDQGWVDEDRMGVYGWSYGGMMTNHVITKTNRFKAAITGASATLYMANYGHDQYQRWWEEELGLPWLEENREIWDKLSPFFKLENVTTPTLIVGGEDDWNVPILNSEQLFIALKRQGVPTKLVVYPEEGHSLSVPSYEKDLYERYFEWLGKYLKK